MGVPLGALLCLPQSVEHLQRFLCLADGSLNTTRAALFSADFISTIQATRYEEIDVFSRDNICWVNGAVYYAEPAHATAEAEQVKFYCYTNLETMAEYLQTRTQDGLALAVPESPDKIIKSIIPLQRLPIRYLRPLFQAGQLSNIADRNVRAAMGAWETDILAYAMPPSVVKPQAHPLAHLSASAAGNLLLLKLKLHDPSFMPEVPVDSEMALSAYLFQIIAIHDISTFAASLNIN